MVEEDAIACVNAIRLAVIHRDPVRIELCYGVWAPGVEGRCLLLGRLLHLAVELARGGLVEPHLLRHVQDAEGLEEPQGTERVSVCSVLGGLKGDLHMRLGSEIIDFARLGLLDNPDKVRRVSQVTVMELERIPFRAGRGKVIDPLVLNKDERRLMPWTRYPFMIRNSQDTPVLTGYSRDESCLLFRHRFISLRRSKCR